MCLNQYCRRCRSQARAVLDHMQSLTHCRAVLDHMRSPTHRRRMWGHAQSLAQRSLWHHSLYDNSRCVHLRDCPINWCIFEVHCLWSCHHMWSHDDLAAHICAQQHLYGRVRISTFQAHHMGRVGGASFHSICLLGNRNSAICRFLASRNSLQSDSRTGPAHRAGNRCCIFDR